MKKTITTILAGAVLGLASASALPLKFDFKDPKGVNNIVFQLDAPLESINGTGSGISGTVRFDPENPGAIEGVIVLDANSLSVPNSTMQEHLTGPRWLDTANFPEITFEAIAIGNAQTDGDTTIALLEGRLTLKGVTQDIVVPLKMTFLPGKLKARGGTDKDGDLLVLRSEFTVLRDDFGINAGQNLDKVSDEIEISLSLVGIAPY
jgi:polyisoprenoid-binding protein YceI